MPTTAALVDAITRAFDVSSHEEDEDAPYKHKYQAADVLRTALGERALAVQQESAVAQDASIGTDGTNASQLGTQDSAPGSMDAATATPVDNGAAEAQTQPSPLEEATAAARVRCGLILLETDLLADGEASIKAGLPVLEKSPDTYMAWLLESYNALGALFCQRGDLQAALQWLQRAEELYQRVTGTGTRHAHLSLPVSLNGSTAAAGTGDADAGASGASGNGGVDGTAIAPGAGDGNSGQVAEAGTAPGGAAVVGAQPSAAVALGAPAPSSTGPAPGAAEAGSELHEAATSSQDGAVERERGTEQQGRAAAGDGDRDRDGDELVRKEEVTGTSAPEPNSEVPTPSTSTHDVCSEAEAAAPELAVVVGDGGQAAEPQSPDERHGLGVDTGGLPASAAEGSSAAPEGGCGPSADPAAMAAAGTDDHSRQGARPTGPEAGPAPSGLRLPLCDPDAVQKQYTSTMFYLAQVYGNMKVADRSALYCAATLYRQLASGKYDLDTWVNNCLQLGGYYAKVNAFGLALYCHAAAQAVADRDTAAGAELGEDIAANIKLATARVYNMRLAASHSKYIEGKDLEVHYPDVSHFPDYLRFAGLSLPAPDSFPWGMAALASTFEGARDLLNAGMPYFKEALSYYQLDGWVTDHVGILMDMSNMYRCLASFEADPNRAAAMHRCRAQLLEPLSGGLNPDHYPGLSRSIDLELAHVHREISDVREVQGGQAAKVAASAASAAKFYQRFLRSFASPDTQQMPDRVDQDNEPYFLMASFGLGRMLQRMRPTGTATDESYNALAVAAHKHLQWTSGYVKRHNLENWTQEAQAAEELSELLVEQIRLRAMAAARRVA